MSTVRCPIHDYPSINKSFEYKSLVKMHDEYYFNLSKFTITVRLSSKNHHKH